ncbi:aminoacyl-tRNA hydrolase [Candidatus Roizmanbacteria bacterium]|nr:aminoacyl-tRNA hydrolase [Candidatus Roizmanbacteria bacterium]
MHLIVGLGNPGEKYKNNRHNVGFMFVDYMAKLLNGSIAKKQFNNITIQQYNNLILAKPLTFMNHSGQAVTKILTDYRVPITDLLVVHDDLDIPIGKFKIQKGVGPRLHNGIESIEKSLGTKDFWRLRIGVDNRNPDNWVDGETYVLNDFLLDEKKLLLKQVFPKILKRLKFDLKI